MGKFSNYVIILRQIGPLHYCVEKGSANIKVRPINCTTHFNIQLFHTITFNIISYHVVKNIKTLANMYIEIESDLYIKHNVIL